MLTIYRACESRSSKEHLSSDRISNNSSRLLTGHIKCDVQRNAVTTLRRATIHSKYVILVCPFDSFITPYHLTTILDIELCGIDMGTGKKKDKTINKNRGETMKKDALAKQQKLRREPKKVHGIVRFGKKKTTKIDGKFWKGTGECSEIFDNLL